MIAVWHNRRRERLDGLCDLLSFARGARLLDVGCNRGLVCYEFAQAGAAVVHGCDISAKAIETAQHLFDDVIGCKSKFGVVDLSKDNLEWFLEGNSYDIVLMLGVYHKLKRQMDEAALERLIGILADRTANCFGWNGFHEERPVIDKTMTAHGLYLVQSSTLSGYVTAIWQRETK